VVTSITTTSTTVFTSSTTTTLYTDVPDTTATTVMKRGAGPTIPSYASVCSSAAFASACSCFGIPPFGPTMTVTAATSTIFSTFTVGTLPASSTTTQVTTQTAGAQAFNLQVVGGTWNGYLLQSVIQGTYSQLLTDWDSPTATCVIDGQGNLICDGFLAVVYNAGYMYYNVIFESITELNSLEPDNNIAQLHCSIETGFLMCDPLNGGIGFSIPSHTLAWMAEPGVTLRAIFIP
jgi:hypothetical protein